MYVVLLLLPLMPCCHIVQKKSHGIARGSETYHSLAVRCYQLPLAPDRLTTSRLSLAFYVDLTGFSLSVVSRSFMFHVRLLCMPEEYLEENYLQYFNMDDAIGQ